MGFVWQGIAWIIAELYRILNIGELAKRYAILLAYITTVASLTFAFYNALYILLFGLSVAIPSEFVTLVAFYFPSNTQLCISVVVSARLLRLSLLWTLRLRTMYAESAMTVR